MCALNVKEASGDRIVMEAFNNTKGTIRDAVNNLIVLLTEYPTEIAPEDIRLINELSENGFINEIKNEKSPSNGSVTQLNDLEFFPDYCEDHTKTTGQLKDYGDFIDLALILDYRIVEFRLRHLLEALSFDGQLENPVDLIYPSISIIDQMDPSHTWRK